MSDDKLLEEANRSRLAFLALLKAKHTSVEEFARLVKMHPNSVYRWDEVPEWAFLLAKGLPRKSPIEIRVYDVELDMAAVKEVVGNLGKEVHQIQDRLLKAEGIAIDPDLSDIDDDISF